MSDRKTIQIIHHAMTSSGYGGMTFLASHTSGDSFITVSTAHCSFNERYTKKIGVKEAQAQYAAGAKIKIGVTKRHLNHAELRTALYQTFNI